MAVERIMTQHPDGRQGVHMELEKYEFIRDEILMRLDEEPMPFMRLAHEMEADLQDTFDGSVMWYTTTVKLDLEARGQIEKVPGTTPPRLRVCYRSDD
jgi:hypothetical protein